MKQAEDNRTVDMIGVGKRGRGRPSATGLPLTPEQIKEAAAERQRRRRARLAQVGVATLTVELPLDVLAGLDEYLRFKDVTKNATIEKLIRQQLLRKR